jgi:hypothetical protein
MTKLIPNPRDAATARCVWRYLLSSGHRDVHAEDMRRLARIHQCAWFNQEDVMCHRLQPMLSLPFVALAIFLAGCQGTEPPVAPTLDRPLFSHSLGHDLKGTIAFTSNRDGDLEIFTMNADGTGARRLAADESGRSSTGAPVWMPDGRHLLFTCC